MKEPFLHVKPDGVTKRAIQSGAISSENEWGGMVRPHVILMAGEHAPNAEQLIKGTGGKILSVQQNRDQFRYLVGNGRIQYNVLVTGLGAESVESGLREYCDALKQAGGRTGFVVRVGSAGGITRGINIGDSFIVKEGLDFSAATTFSHPRRTHPIPRLIFGNFIPFLKRHLYKNFALSAELENAAARLNLGAKTGRCVSVGTFGHFYMRKKNGGIAAVREEWRKAHAVKSHAKMVEKIGSGAQDMESAAIAAYIHHAKMNLRYGAVLGISDHLEKPGEWHPFTPLVNPFMIALESILADASIRR
ncbi:TPA: hypothetical protein HA244_06245 [Candidatus Micrarchaeota archaeon]|nr:hypothetical protein [Candidatus Micrarchaeota archaeon]